MKLTVVAKVLKLMAIHKGIVPRRPRRLVGESHIPPGLSPAYTRASKNMSSIRLAGEFRKIGTGTKSRPSTL